MVNLRKSMSTMMAKSAAPNTSKFKQTRVASVSNLKKFDSVQMLTSKADSPRQKKSLSPQKLVDHEKIISEEHNESDQMTIPQYNAEPIAQPVKRTPQFINSKLEFSVGIVKTGASEIGSEVLESEEGSKSSLLKPYMSAKPNTLKLIFNMLDQYQDKSRGQNG
jgi:hypothetical protein